MGEWKIYKIAVAARQHLLRTVASGWVRAHRARLFQAYLLVTLLAFIALAVLANTTPYFNFDLLFTRELQSEIPPWFGFVLTAVSWPGYMGPSIFVTAIMVSLLAVFGLRWQAVSALLAALTSTGLNAVVKAIIRRPRPSSDLVDVFQTLSSYSFPSGHTMFYTTFFGFFLFLSFTLLKRSWIRTSTIILFTALIVLVGPSRLYLGEHWASDVAGGYLLGSLTLILAIQIYLKGKTIFADEQPLPAAQTDQPANPASESTPAKKGG